MEFLVDDYVYKVTYDPAYSNNEINSGKNHETYTLFSAAVREETHGKNDNLFICPPNVILDLFRLLALPYYVIYILLLWFNFGFFCVLLLLSA